VPSSLPACALNRFVLCPQVLAEGVPAEVVARDAAWNAKGGSALPKTVKP